MHVHISILSPFATVAAHQAASLGLPTAVTVHSMWSRLGPLPAAACTLLRLRTWPIAWSAVSERAAEPLRVMLGPEITVRVLPNAVEPERWRGGEIPRSAPAVPTVISVMRMTHTKRTLPLARILRDVRRRLPSEQPLRAMVVGEGPQRAALERYLRRHRMDWVELPGRLDRAAIRSALTSSAVYLAPAELESFGIAALEARTAGLPVVASSRSGVGEFVTHGTEGLLGPTDAALAAHVTRLLTDDALRSAITLHNQTVPPRHDWAEAGRRNRGPLPGRGRDRGSRPPHLSHLGGRLVSRAAALHGGLLPRPPRRRGDADRRDPRPRRGGRAPGRARRRHTR